MKYLAFPTAAAGGAVDITAQWPIFARRIMWLRNITMAAFIAALAGCATENEPRQWAKVDRQAFECAVQPIFDRECSMPACHGNPLRRLRVLAPGRMRMPAELSKALAAQSHESREAGDHPALTAVELDFNFAQARSMIAPGQAVADCPLLNRPLAVAAGGMYHAEGGDIFANSADADYLTLEAWVTGMGKEQLCK
jgi:hypothetical protein